MVRLPKNDPDWRPTALPGSEEVTASGLRVRTYRFPAPGVSVAGRRLVFFSDLHWTEPELPLAESLLAAVNGAEADWLVFGGDLVRYLDRLDSAMAFLGLTKARRCKLAVLGNWERQHSWFPVARWRELYASFGFQLLVNECWADADTAGPVFLGLDDYRQGNPRIVLGPELASNGCLVVCISHSPDALGQTTGTFFGHLGLAGHTHGGQVRVPWFGALFTSSRYWKTFEHGWFRRRSDGAWLHVSSGIGCTGMRPLRRRLFCPPEVVILDLVPAAPPGVASGPAATRPAGS